MILWQPKFTIGQCVREIDVCVQRWSSLVYIVSFFFFGGGGGGRLLSFYGLSCLLTFSFNFFLNVIMFSKNIDFPWEKTPLI